MLREDVVRSGVEPPTFRFSVVRGHEKVTWPLTSVHRLSLRGNRRINHAIHMAAITQISHKHSPGRAYYDKKIAEGRTHKDALRSLKRRISDTIYARLQADARQAAKTREKAREGNQGTTLTPARPAHTPNASSSDKPLPDPTPPYDPPPSQDHATEADFEENPPSRLTPAAKRTRSARFAVAAPLRSRPHITG